MYFIAYANMGLLAAVIFDVESKKRAQGKPYYVYMTAGANKFLRIYYGRVKEYLSSLPES